jgi:hypothetical protein
MPKERPRRHSVEIKDDEDKTKLFMAADWTEEELRTVIAQIMRLGGLPDNNSLTRQPVKPGKKGRGTN